MLGFRHAAEESHIHKRTAFKDKEGNRLEMDANIEDINLVDMGTSNVGFL